MNNNIFCPLCSDKTTLLGKKQGKLDGRDFFIRTCNTCYFSFVQNPRVDYENIYNANYYHGYGGDPEVNYIDELMNFAKTIRNYEWNGIYKIFKQFKLDSATWLDYGCGIGGLVKFGMSVGVKICGFEEGVGANIAKSFGIPILNSDELNAQSETYDFISLIEVLEHVSNPIELLKKIRKLLKPGGILYVTTGNSTYWQKNILSWHYTDIPDVHVSFFRPENLKFCMEAAGFRPKQFEFTNGLTEIIKYKILKSLGRKNKNKLYDILPWEFIADFVNARYQISQQPYGIAI